MRLDFHKTQTILLHQFLFLLTNPILSVLLLCLLTNSEDEKPMDSDHELQMHFLYDVLFGYPYVGIIQIRFSVEGHTFLSACIQAPVVQL